MDQVLILEAGNRLYYWNTDTGAVQLLGQIDNALDLKDVAVLADGRVFVNTETQILEVDMSNFATQVVADLGEGGRANGLGGTDQNTLLVSYRSETVVREIDPNTGDEVSTIDTEGSLSLGDVTTDGQSIYMANQAQGIDVYDIATGDLVSSNPHGLGGTVFALSYNDGLIAYAERSAYRVPTSGPAVLEQDLPLIAPIFGAAAFLTETPIGTALDDVLVGDATDNVIMAREGDDTITGGGDDDTIDGGAGTDISVYSGPRASYSLEISGAGVSVEDRRGTDGMDFLSNVETIRFADQDWELERFDEVADLDPAVFTQFVEMYIAYFDRAPDAEGLFFWGDALNNGTTLETIAALFFDQDETRALYPADTTTGEFVDAVYDNVLGRDIDQLGFDFWVGVLDSGAVSRPTFMLDIIAGAKAPAPDGATQEFIDQKAADIEYLTNKTDLGTYFSVIRGMSDVDNARSVMDLYDGTAESITAAQNAIDGFFADAQDADSGEFLLSLVGVVDDPFMM